MIKNTCRFAYKLYMNIGIISIYDIYQQNNLKNFYRVCANTHPYIFTVSVFFCSDTHERV